MIKRGLALSLVLGLASVAQGGAVLELRPLQSGNAALPLGTYIPNEVVTVELFLKQSPAGDDHLVRLLKLHYDDSAPELALGGHVWSYGTNGHYKDEDRAGGPPGVAIAYVGEGECSITLASCNIAEGCPDWGSDPQSCNPTGALLGPRPPSMLTLPGDGTAVKVATLEVTMPGDAGTYGLDAMNALASVDLKAAVSWGYACAGACNQTHPDSNAPITFWRANADFTGGTVNLTVAPPDDVDFDTWESVVNHGSTVGDVPLTIAEDGSFVESRMKGITKILVSFTGAIDPATVPGSVTITGCDTNGTSIDLSTTTITAVALAGDTQMEISVSPKLYGSGPADRPAKYLVTATGITSAGGGAVGGTNSRYLRAIVGDVVSLPNGSGHVNSSDAGLTRSFAASGVDPIDPGNTAHVRADVTGDGKVNSSDAGLVRSMAAQAKDGRSIPCP